MSHLDGMEPTEYATLTQGRIKAYFPAQLTESHACVRLKTLLKAEARSIVNAYLYTRTPSTDRKR